MKLIAQSLNYSISQVESLHSTARYSISLTQIRQTNILESYTAGALTGLGRHRSHAFSIWLQQVIGSVAQIKSTLDLGLPSAPEDCRVANETMASLHVICIKGWDGGLKQSFYLELWGEGM